MGRTFPQYLKNVLQEGHWILIYPEQEMWFNYRKPRPLQRGAYYYAATNNVPIISCFVEIKTTSQIKNVEFYQTKYRVHILPPIYPDPQLSPKENSLRMRDRDYQQKKQAYEAAYHEPLTYTWEANDIAGWRGQPLAPLSYQDESIGVN